MAAKLGQVTKSGDAVHISHAARLDLASCAMARLARVVMEGAPRHCSHRGNRRRTVFSSDGDHGAYGDPLAEGCRAAATEIWADCLMSNHVHLILVSSDPDGLRAALSEAHRRHCRRVNIREGWRCHRRW
jgi:putative transposase